MNSIIRELRKRLRDILEDGEINCPDDITNIINELIDAKIDAKIEKAIIDLTNR